MMRRGIGAIGLLCLLACVLLPLSAWGQGTTSRITGTITDKTGAVVAGATVTAKNEGTNTSYTITSSQTGVYAFDSLQVGTYTVSVESKGFKKFISVGNVLSIGLPTTVNAALEVGAVGEQVEVQGGYDLVQTDSSGNTGNVVDTVTVTQLPIVGTRGRNPLALVSMIPGVVDNGGNATGGGVSVHGSRDRAWNYTLDGVDVNESSSGGGNSSPIKANPDSISEFRVITGNFTPEYGRNSGGQVTMVTKSGTNNFHGTGFWFYQSPFLMANSSPNKALTPQKGRSQFVQNIPGGSLGGPIQKDKTFFFANVQLLHAANSTLITRTVYTDLAKGGLFRYAIGSRNKPYGTTGATVDQNGNPVAGVNVGTYNIVANDPAHIGLDPAVQKYLGMEPSPNNFTVGDGLNTAGYTFVAPQLEKQVDLTFKVDHNFSQNNMLFVRWYSGHQNTFGDTANSGSQAFPGLPNFVDTRRTPRNMAINWRTVPTSTTTNELVLGFNRFGYEFVNPDPNLGQPSSPPFNFNNVAAPLSSWVNNNRYLTTLQALDNFTWIKGAHTLKWGANFRYGREIDHRGSIGTLNAMPQVYFGTGDNPVDLNLFNVSSLSGINTTYDRATLLYSINDLLGRVGQIQQGYVSAADSQSFKPATSWNSMDHRWPEYDFYFQDSWKVKSNLTIDYGMRWEIRIAPHLVGFPDLVPDQSVLFGATPSDTLKFVPGKLFNSAWKNFGPSLGFAWDPFKNGKSSVRGHYRIAYDRINPFSFSSSVFQGMPGLTYQAIDNKSGQDTVASGVLTAVGMRAQNWQVPAPPAGLTPEQLRQLPAYGAGSLTVADPNMRTPRVYMWGLSIQREIAKNTVVSLSYNGNHGVALYGGYDANQVNYVSNGFLDAFKVVQAGGDSPLFNQLFQADSRRLSTQTGSQFARSTYPSSFTYNNVAGLANTIATRMQGGIPLVVLDGMSPYFFKPYPQVLGAMNVLTTRDFSNYNGMEAQIERRFSNGLLFQASWTWSKSQDVRSFDPAFTTIATGSSQAATATPYNFHTPALNYGPSDFDRTHVIQSNWVYELPFGKGKMFGKSWNGVLNQVLGGWEIAGNFVWETGRPITFVSGYNTFSSAVQTPAQCLSGCSPYMGSVYRDPTIGQQFYFTPEQAALLSTPAPGEFGNLGRNYFRQNRVYNINATITKNFRITERQNLQARLEMQNVTNSEFYDTFGSQSIQSSVFTRLNQAVDGVMNGSQRRMQLSLKYTF